MHICFGGPIYTIDIGGTKYRFEHHPACGPFPIKKNGDPRKIPFRHRFWHAVSMWAMQGEKVDNEGNCIYEQPDWVIR